MKIKIPVLIFGLSCIFSIGAQSGPHSRILFNASSAEMRLIAEQGVALDHLHKSDSGYIGEFSSEETCIIYKLCKQVKTLVADLTQHFLKLGSHQDIKRTGLTYPVPAGFSLGSMGGYLTLHEADSHINAIMLQHPNIVSKKDSIGTSVLGRTIYAFKVSDNPGNDEEEAEVLYTAVHHAREPMSVMQMVYFLYYMMENYGHDSDVTYIVNNCEMYFIPFVNPDGYVYNQETDPNGGGYWRKNRRKTSDTTYGIDLNRNYGYNWGMNNLGSSPYPLSETYRGSASFSEPETRAIRDFCMQRQFLLALNYHSFGNYLIYPWGNDAGSSTTPDAPVFYDLAAQLTVENYYTAGTCKETLDYVVNGNSDDWMYGEQTGKEKIYAFTPEVGNGTDGFWPAVDRIHTLCDENIRQNINLAKAGISMKKSSWIPRTEWQNFSVYPNPAQRSVQLRNYPEEIVEVQIYDSKGDLVMRTCPDDMGGIDISILGQGVYYLRIQSEGTIRSGVKLLVFE